MTAKTDFFQTALEIEQEELSSTHAARRLIFFSCQRCVELEVSRFCTHSMPTIKEDIATASDWISRALRSSGYCADFTPESLWEIDRFFDEHSAGGAPKPGGLLFESVGSRIFALGSYIGEVLRRHLGGDWHGDDRDPQVEIHVELRLPDGAVCWPMQRAMKRLTNGPEDGIAAYGLGLGAPVGPPPPKPAKGFFRRLFGR